MARDRCADADVSGDDARNAGGLAGDVTADVSHAIARGALAVVKAGYERRGVVLLISIFLRPIHRRLRGDRRFRAWGESSVWELACLALNGKRVSIDEDASVRLSVYRNAPASGDMTRGRALAWRIDRAPYAILDTGRRQERGTERDRHAEVCERDHDELLVVRRRGLSIHYRQTIGVRWSGYRRGLGGVATYR